MKWLVYLYPRSWLRRYGDEFMALLEDCPRRPGLVIDAVLGACDAHWTVLTQQNWSAARMLRGSLLVLATVLVFAVTYIAFSMAIHFVVADVFIPMFVQPGVHVVAPWVPWLLFGLVPMLLALACAALGLLRLRSRLSRNLAVNDA